MHLQTFLATALVAATASAHPGHDIAHEVARRRAFLANHVNNIDHCADMHKASGLEDRNVARRHRIAKRLVEQVQSTLHGPSELHVSIEVLRRV